MVDAGRELLFPVAVLLLDAYRGGEEFSGFMTNGTHVTDVRRRRGRTTIPVVHRIPSVWIGGPRQRREVDGVVRVDLAAVGHPSVLGPWPVDAATGRQDGWRRWWELQIHEPQNRNVGRF